VDYGLQIPYVVPASRRDPLTFMERADDGPSRTVENAAIAGFDEVHFLPTSVDPAEIDRLEDVLAGL
jgi:hypothetical protein